MPVVLLGCIRASLRRAKGLMLNQRHGAEAQGQAVPAPDREGSSEEEVS